LERHPSGQELVCKRSKTECGHDYQHRGDREMVLDLAANLPPFIDNWPTIRH
jgi:hypothetical protein